MRTRHAISICIALALAGCAQRPRPTAPPAVVAAPVPQTARPRFTIEASSNDTWNAVGQVLVRTPGVDYDGRAQMLGLYAIRYRGEPLMVMTHALPLSGAITRTTEVTVTPRRDPAVDYDNAATLFALLERALPAELDSVRARFAAEKLAKVNKPKGRKKKSRK